MDSGRGGSDPPEPQWWHSLPGAEATIGCGETQHVIRWADGKLTLPAHPDAEAELVLSALGAEHAECVELAQMWGRHTDDLDVLALGPRSAADRVPFSWDGPGLASSTGPPGPPGPPGPASPVGQPGPASQPGPARPAQPASAAGSGGQRQGSRRRVVTARIAPAILRGSVTPFGVAAPGPPGRVPGPGLPGRRRVDPDPDGRRASRIELLSLLALGPAFQLRLAGAVAAGLDGQARAGHRAANRPRLAAALTGRLAPAAQEWLGIDPDRVTAAVHEGPGWGSLQLTGTGTGGGRGLRASLPVAWLARVWACGLAVAGGHLVVAVRAARWPEAEVLALPEPGAEPAVLRLRGSLPGGTADDGPRWEVAGNDTAAGAP